MKLAYLLLIIGQFSLFLSFYFPTPANAETTTEQNSILASVVTAGCARDGPTRYKSCMWAGKGFSETLINQDPNMFEKNLAGLIVQICSRFTGEEEELCFGDTIGAGNSASLSDMYFIYGLAATYQWAFSTKIRRFLFTSRGPGGKYANNAAYNYFYYRKFNPLFLKILVEYADPKTPLEDYRVILRRNGIDPNENYILKMSPP